MLTNYSLVMDTENSLGVQFDNFIINTQKFCHFIFVRYAPKTASAWHFKNVTHNYLFTNIKYEQVSAVTNKPARHDT